LDDNSPETFYRPEKDEANLIVKIKGKIKSWMHLSLTTLRMETAIKPCGLMVFQVIR